MVDISPHLANDTGQIHAGDERELGFDLVAPLDHQRIGKVQGCATDFDQNFIIVRWRDVNILNPALIDRSEFGAHKCLHEFSLVLEKRI